ncbi:PHD finger protein ALFIN-LIKE 6-like [Hypomesus transpacificus]|uniref:PHD finger protein ALFIN-LIKE 6-like n=1 Tax=Hypomesus transpacificus TaxID=137520 RepID=UPI001F07F013|nr:PHD finger protein ALFIN-LIKE 6-like [Hypomesus transpacificus]
MKGEAINIKTTQKAVNKLRLDVATALLRETDNLSNLCHYCGMEDKDEPLWICCDICGRWYHHECVQRPTLEEDYWCLACT